MPGHDAIDEPGAAPSIDFRGSRRLVGAEEWFWYVAAATTYIVFGIWHKWLLNWFVGPAWLVAFIVIGPWLTDRVGLTSRGAGPGDVTPTDPDAATGPSAGMESA